MKLKNLLFVSLLATAFVACSNEEDLGGNQPQEVKGQPASLNVGVKTANAIARDVAADATVSSLRVAIYDETTRGLVTVLKTGEDLTQTDGDNSPVDGGTLATEGSYTTDNLLAVSEGTNYWVVVFANMTDATLPTNLNAGGSLLLPADGFVENALPMSSDAILVKLYPGDNYIGYSNEEIADELAAGAHNAYSNDIMLQRNVAKITLNDLVLDLNKGKTDNNKIFTSADATFNLSNVYITNAANKSYAFSPSAAGTADASTTYCSGLMWGDYTNATTYYAQTPSSEISLNQTNVSTSVSSTPSMSFYVLANNGTEADANNATKLIIRGAYTLKAGAEFADGSVDNIGFNADVTNYVIPIHNGVIERNYKYIINATITGKGVGSLDTGEEVEAQDIFIQVKVADWEGNLQEDVTIGDDNNGGVTPVVDEEEVEE